MGAGGRGINRPTMPRIIDGLDSRVFGLETRRPLDDRPPSERFDVPFSFPGALSASLSPRFYPRASARLTAVLFSLDTAGSAATTFKVYASGSVLTPAGVDSNMTIVTTTTLSLTATNEVGVAYFDDVFSKDADYLQIEIVSVGTGAADLTAQARFG